MTIVTDFKSGRLADTMSKKFGRANELGEIIIGDSRYGDTQPNVGIYQSRPRKTGRIIVRSKHCFPKRSTCEARTQAESRLRAGVIAWQGMSAEERKPYNDKAKNLPYSGYNLFIKRAVESI